MPNNVTFNENFKKAYSIPEVCEISGLGRSSVYAALTSGKLAAMKHGRRTIIPAAAVDAWIAGLPRFPTKAKPNE